MCSTRIYYTILLQVVSLLLKMPQEKKEAGKVTLGGPPTVWEVRTGPEVVIPKCFQDHLFERVRQIKYHAAQITPGYPAKLQHHDGSYPVEKQIIVLHREMLYLD